MKLFFILMILLSSATRADEVSLTMGIVPQQAASKLARLWGPIIHKLSQNTDLKIRFVTAPNIPTFEQRLAQGEYDIAYMNPYHFTVFNEAPGYKAIAKAENKKIKGIFVTQKDSPITDLTELDGTTLAFPAPAAFAATLLTQAELKKRNISFIPKYVSSHDSVYQAVAKGIYPAGGGIVRTLNNIDPAIKSQLRILWTSDGFTPHAVAIHPRLNVQTTQKIREAITHLHTDEEGKQLLAALNITAFEAANDSEWDDVRSLNINSFLSGQ